MKVVYLTAGAAGMFCGSCMHDNALARAMTALKIDCVLQPVYTPIRTDEESVAGHRVFLGGIHIYLLQQMPWVRFVPRPMRGVLDFPPLIRWATRKAGRTDPAMLGDLSISMLRGARGKQVGEFQRLVDWIADDIGPDAIVLTNLLIGGGLPEMRSRMPNAKLIVMLQGDDIFLDHLPETDRATAISLCSDLVQHVDYFYVHSQFYAQKMAALLNIPASKLVVRPLSIDLRPFDLAAEHQNQPTPSPTGFKLGYFARIAPEKGLHRLVEVFEMIAADHPDITLHAAGWLGEHNRPYLAGIEKRLADAGLSDRFTYHGSPDLAAKTRFLRDMDLVSVPTEYEDPKGLFVLESLAAGTPVVMPDHGAFGELVHSTGGGVLVPPNDLKALAGAIVDLKSDPDRRSELVAAGREAIHRKHTIEQSAAGLVELIRG